MPNPTAAALIIGDEILSGRTQDRNTRFLARALTQKGIDLKEVRVVGDSTEAIVGALNALRDTHDHVFTSGGIGPTHDDITAEAVAEAFGVTLAVRADARAVLEAHYRAAGMQMTPGRLRMARIPGDAELIDNPVSGAPGFSLGNVHVMAGVPAVFEAMVASVLKQLEGGQVLSSRTLRLDRGESEIAAPLARLAGEFPELSIGSYPFRHEGIHGTSIVVRGADPALVDRAVRRLARMFPEARS